METDLLHTGAVPRFSRPAAEPGSPAMLLREIESLAAELVSARAELERERIARDEAETELARERGRRERFERAANELARIVAREGRRAQLELERRMAAEETAAGMAELVARENARANAAEARLR